MATLDLLVGATAADLSPQPGHLWVGFSRFRWRELAMARRRHTRATLAGTRPDARGTCAYPGASGRGRQPCDEPLIERVFCREHIDLLGDADMGRALRDQPIGERRGLVFRTVQDQV